MDKTRFDKNVALLHPKGHSLIGFSEMSKEVYSFRHGWIQGPNNTIRHLFHGSAFLCVHSKVCSPNLLVKMALATCWTYWGHKTDSSLSPEHCKLGMGCGWGGGWLDGSNLSNVAAADVSSSLYLS